MDRGIASLKAGAKIYFIGIGGISMCGLARLASGYGFDVAGSDMAPSERTEELARDGIRIYNRQVASNIEEFAPDYAVKTAAILPHNPEVAECNARGIRVFDRAEFLGLITDSYERVINISGTHGKTTTTSMTTLIMMEDGADPAVHIGAEFDEIGGTVRQGGGFGLLVSEACEFNHSFLHFRSTTAVITNIDHDHVDIYPTIDDVIEAFAMFLDKADDKGYVVVTGSDENTAKAVGIAKARHAEQGRAFPEVITCGLEDTVCAVSGKAPDFAAANVTFECGLPVFDLLYKGDLIGKVSLHVPGKHNIFNALNAAAAAYLNGASPEAVVAGLNRFSGADGRYTVKGKYRGATVVVDYAHHPAAARATMEAASNMPHNNILVVFQPLTFNRTKLLFEDYVTSLLPCRKVLFAEIFSDREINNHDISSKDISDEINARGGDAEFYEDRKDLVARIDELIEPDDILLILGPEDIRTLGDELVKD